MGPIPTLLILLKHYHVVLCHMTDRDIVRNALRAAIDWELGLLDAQACDPELVAESKKTIAGYRRVLRKRYGHDRSFQETLMDEFRDTPNVSAHDIIKEMSGVQEDN